MATPPPASDKTIKDTTKSVVDANASVEAATQGTTAAVKTGVDATKKVVEQVGNVAGALGNVATTIADSNKSLLTAAGKTTTSVEKVTSGIEKTATATRDALEGIGKKINEEGAARQATSDREREVLAQVKEAISKGGPMPTFPDFDYKALGELVGGTASVGQKQNAILFDQVASALKAAAYEKTVGKLMGVIAPIGGTMDKLISFKPQDALRKMGEGFLGKMNKFKGGEAAVSGQMEKALQKIGKGSEDLVNMTDAQRKEALARFAAEGKDTSELHNLLIGENKLSQAQLQAGAELIGERSEEDIAKGKGDARIDPASETSLQKLFR